MYCVLFLVPLKRHVRVVIIAVLFFGVTVRNTAFVSLIYFMQVGLPMLCLYPLQYTAKSAIQHVPSPQIKFDCSGSMILYLFSLIVIVDRLFLFH